MKHPIASISSVGIMSVGVYTIALIAWMFVLIIASVFGFYPEEEIRKDRERVLFSRAHQNALCFRERIPGAYCDEIFRKSAA